MAEMMVACRTSAEGRADKLVSTSVASRTRSVLDPHRDRGRPRSAHGPRGGFDELDIHSSEAVPMLDDRRSGTLRTGLLIRVSPSGLASWRSSAVKAAMTSGAS
jgi:hypothetical protein